MVFLRTNLILGIIWHAIKLVFTVVYKVLKLLHLRLTFLILVAGVVLYFTGTLDNFWYRMIFYAALGLSVLLAIFLCLRRLFGKKR